MKVGGIPWLCLEHNLVFGKDSELLFHAQKTHNTTLLFFCKRCFFATLNEITIVRHLRDCCVVKPTTEVWPQTASLQGEAGLGVVAANAVHYQPHDEKQWIMALKSAGRPETAHPSLCIHRTLLAQNHSVILCKDRDCNTWYVQPTYLATFEEETDRVLALQTKSQRTFL
ncbi:unnamed protein product, partial [Mesorhabditis belari]|uniref:Uncharacterized protein n=1 Tax=Mesorhabditis belari TaxID=2138241 RepID=A0AAF3F862_9BILA